MATRYVNRVTITNEIQITGTQIPKNNQENKPFNLSSRRQDNSNKTRAVNNKLIFNVRNHLLLNLHEVLVAMQVKARVDREVMVKGGRNGTNRK